MESTVFQTDIEDIGNGIIDLLEAELETIITDLNNLKNDGIEITMPDNILFDSPVNGFTLLDVSQYPAIFVEPIRSKDLNNDDNNRVFQFIVSGWIREEDRTLIMKKNLRFALAIKETLKKDATLDGIVGGFVIADIDYTDPFKVRQDTMGFYTACMIDISYYW